MEVGQYAQSPSRLAHLPKELVEANGDGAAERQAAINTATNNVTNELKAGRLERSARRLERAAKIITTPLKLCEAA